MQRHRKMSKDCLEIRFFYSFSSLFTDFICLLSIFEFFSLFLGQSIFIRFFVYSSMYLYSYYCIISLYKLIIFNYFLLYFITNVDILLLLLSMMGIFWKCMGSFICKHGFPFYILELHII